MPEITSMPYNHWRSLPLPIRLILGNGHVGVSERGDYEEIKRDRADHFQRIGGNNWNSRIPL